MVIARTILKDPRNIWLDETTATLITVTKQYIQSALEKLSRRLQHASRMVEGARDYLRNELGTN